jgi:hypothetical protein
MIAVENSGATCMPEAGILIQSSVPALYPGPEIARRDTWSGQERRREVRYETSDPVQVYFLDLGGLSLPGVVRDISRSGLRVEIGIPLVQGARLKIRLRNHSIFGEVRYCRKGMGGYHAGVAIDDVYFAPGVAARTDAKPEMSGQESHALARFIVDDHLSAAHQETLPVSMNEVQ